MFDIRELSFCELKRKDVVNVCDGRRLGHIVDMIFSPSTAKVQGIVAPYGKRWFCFNTQEVYIPYANIKTIGEDVILVDVNICEPCQSQRGRKSMSSPQPESKKDKSDCVDEKNVCDLGGYKSGTVYVDNSRYN